MKKLTLLLLLITFSVFCFAGFRTPLEKGNFVTIIAYRGGIVDLGYNGQNFAKIGFGYYIPVRKDGKPVEYLGPFTDKDFLSGKIDDVIKRYGEHGFKCGDTISVIMSPGFMPLSAEEGVKVEYKPGAELVFYVTVTVKGRIQKYEFTADELLK